MKTFLISLAIAAGIGGYALAVVPVFAAGPSTAPQNVPGGAPGWGHAGAGWHGIANGQRPVVVGQVASINGDVLTVTSHDFGPHAAAATTTYTVTANGATVMVKNATSTLSSINIGDRVFIQGTASGTNVTATSIRDLGPQGQRPNPANFPIKGNGEPVVAGKVTQVSGATVIITNSSNVTYTIDASNATVMKGNATSTLSSVNVGDSVIVQGAVNGTTVTASSVIDQTNPGQNAPGKGNHLGFFGSIGAFFTHLFGFF